MSKVLFLDIDGVLNSEAFVESRGPRPSGKGLELDLWHLDRNAVALLQRIVDETGCMVVVSSDWRREPFKPGFQRTCDALLASGLRGRPVGATPVLTDVERLELFGVGWGGNYTPRWMECQAWLMTNGLEGATCVALADCADFEDGGWKERLVQIDADVGLTEGDVLAVIDKLGRQ